MSPKASARSAIQIRKEPNRTIGANPPEIPRRRPRAAFHSGSSTDPRRRATRSEARLPPGTTTVSNTSRRVIAASTTPTMARRASTAMAAVTAQAASRVQDAAARRCGRGRSSLTWRLPLSSWAPALHGATTDNSAKRHEQAPGHEDSQQFEVAQDAPPGLPCHPPPRPDLRHQQDEPAVQGAPGLTSLRLRFGAGLTTLIRDGTPSVAERKRN